MGNLFTKCCKESETDSEKRFGELEVNGTKRLVLFRSVISAYSCKIDGNS